MFRSSAGCRAAQTGSEARAPRGSTSPNGAARKLDSEPAISTGNGAYCLQNKTFSHAAFYFLRRNKVLIKKQIKQHSKKDAYSRNIAYIKKKKLLTSPSTWFPSFVAFVGQSSCSLEFYCETKHRKRCLLFSLSRLTKLPPQSRSVEARRGQQGGRSCYCTAPLTPTCNHGRRKRGNDFVFVLLLLSLLVLLFLLLWWYGTLNRAAFNNSPQSSLRQSFKTHRYE